MGACKTPLKKFFFLIYLAALGLSCVLWDLIPWAGVESGHRALGLWSLSHWANPHRSLKIIPLTGTEDSSIFAFEFPLTNTVSDRTRNALSFLQACLTEFSLQLCLTTWTIHLQIPNILIAFALSPDFLGKSVISTYAHHNWITCSIWCDCPEKEVLLVLQIQWYVIERKHEIN